MVQSEACIVMVLAGCRNFFSNLQNYCVNHFTRNWTSETCSQTLLYKVQTRGFLGTWGVAKPIQAKKSTNEINSFGKRSLENGKRINIASNKININKSNGRTTSSIDTERQLHANRNRKWNIFFTNFWSTCSCLQIQRNLLTYFLIFWIFCWHFFILRKSNTFLI